MLPTKGTLAFGADADIAIWDPQETRRVTVEDQHDQMDYSPFEGRELTGWPVTVLSLGTRVIDGGKLLVEPGHGNFVAPAPSDLGNQPGHEAMELDPEQNFGAKIAPLPN